MSELLQAEGSALESGDAAAILASGRALAAFASRLLGDLYAAQNRDVEAAEAYRLSLSTAPNPATWMQLASLRHTADDLPATIAALSSAVSLAPEAGSLHLALGTAYWELNEYGYNAETLREFREAQRLSPTDYLSNYNLGVVLSQYLRYEEAATFLRVAAAADAALPDPWVPLGMNSYAQNRFPEAEISLKKAIELTGRDTARNNYQLRRVYAVLSRIAANAGRDAEAGKYTALAEEIHHAMSRTDVAAPLSQSTSVTANINAGQARSAPIRPVAQAARAGEAQLEAQLKGVLANSLNDAGTSLARNRDYAGALPLFRQAASADPTFVPAVRNLGLAAFHMGEYREAVAALTRSLQQNPDDTTASNYLQQSQAHLQTEPGHTTP